MSLCQGQLKQTKHNGPLYRCRHCGAHGCTTPGCSNQRFEWGNGRCLACAGFNGKVPA